MERGKEGQITATRGQLGQRYVLYLFFFLFSFLSTPLTDPMMFSYGYAWTAINPICNGYGTLEESQGFILILHAECTEPVFIGRARRNTS